MPRIDVRRPLAPPGHPARSVGNRAYHLLADTGFSEAGGRTVSGRDYVRRMAASQAGTAAAGVMSGLTS